MAAPPPARPAQVVTGRARVRETDVRGFLALMSSALFFLLLFITLAYRPDMFELVAASTSGLVGTIWGYYFGKKAG